ncbi:SRPBCC family protein [Amycolatopsis taiwanensis]|uniref:SRPBCC family protein n=1 Tax=Amycolatopsis taiwanensis TaxID=342230 RepID=UPI0004848D8F|nr:SRPBCC family protein [Amycolatopsis taiwanensis]
MFNVTHQVSAVQRRIGKRVLEAGEARVLTIGQTYDSTVDDVWDACTNLERIPRWLMPISGDLRLGGRYQLEGNAGGTIESCDPPKRFSATWEFGGEVSWIEVRLSATPDDRTRLELEHVAHVDDQRWAEFGPGAVGIGWDMMLLGLATHLESGRGIDPAESAAWSQSGDGKRFMALSSEQWCQASIEAGTDEAEARAAAARIHAMYTGATPDASAERPSGGE